MDLKKYSPILIPAAAALFVFFFYLSTVPASVYMGDDGETITCLKTLGIQHPPGYPLHTMLGSIFTNMPLGDMSYRIYLFSAIISMACFFMVYLIFSRLLTLLSAGAGPFTRVLAPLFFSLSFTVWEQSTIAKGGVYMLNILFILMLSWLLIEMYSKSLKSRKYFFLFFFVFGLSLCHHHMTQLIMVPAYFFLAFKSKIFRESALKHYLFAAGLFIIGLTAYLYLPLRADSAILNWGSPSTPENFMEVITRWQYVRSEGTRSLEGSLRQALKFFSSSAYAYAYAGAALVAAGMFMMFRREKNLFIFLAAIPATLLLVTSIYLNLQVDRLYIMETYISPVYFPFSVFAAFGIVFACSLIKPQDKKIRGWIAAALGCGIITSQILMFYPRLDKSSYFFTYDYNKNLLDSMDFNSIAFTTGDGVVFPGWYFKYVKHYRTDITQVGSAVLPMQWVRDNIKKQNPLVRVPGITSKQIGTESTGYIINAIIKMNYASFPVYFSYNKPEENALNDGLTLMPKGVVFKALAAAQAVPTYNYEAALDSIWKFYNYRGIFDRRGKMVDKKTLDLFVRDYSVSLNSTGTFFEDAGLNDRALYYFTRAHYFAPGDHEYIYNMGNGYYNTGKLEKAAEMYRESVRIKPDYENGWYNLAVTSYGMKNYAEALKSFKKIKELNPARADVDPYIAFIEKLNTLGVGMDTLK